MANPSMWLIFTGHQCSNKHEQKRLDASFESIAGLQRHLAPELEHAILPFPLKQASKRCFTCCSSRSTRLRRVDAQKQETPKTEDLRGTKTPEVALH